MLKKFAGYYKPHLKLFVLDMLCAFTVAVLNLVYPRVAGKIIEVKDMNYVLIFSGVLLGVFALKAARRRRRMSGNLKEGLLCKTFNGSRKRSYRFLPERNRKTRRRHLPL